MSGLQPTIALLLGLALVLPAAGSAAQEETSPTNAEAAAKATEMLLDELVDALPEAAPRNISLRAARPNAFNADLEAVLAPRLLDEGYSVWVLEDGEEPAEGSLLLEYQVLSADLRYPGERRGFLSLGTPRIEREVVLEVEGRLRDPSDGRLWWSGSPFVRYEDDFPGSERSLIERDKPGWMRGVPTLAAGDEARAGFWEKAFVVGLLGGVVALYVGGAR